MSKHPQVGKQHRIEEVPNLSVQQPKPQTREGGEPFNAQALARIWAKDALRDGLHEERLEKVFIAVYEAGLRAAGQPEPTDGRRTLSEKAQDSMSEFERGFPYDNQVLTTEDTKRAETARRQPEPVLVCQICARPVYATDAIIHSHHVGQPEQPRETLAQLRAAGWMVAVHNDYRQNGEFKTFWLFTRDGYAIKGEGSTDEEALEHVRAALAAAPPSEGEK